MKNREFLPQTQIPASYFSFVGSFFKAICICDGISHHHRTSYWNVPSWIVLSRAGRAGDGITGTCRHKFLQFLLVKHVKHVYGKKQETWCAGLAC